MIFPADSRSVTGHPFFCRESIKKSFADMEPAETHRQRLEKKIKKRLAELERASTAMVIATATMNKGF